ncbi:MAG: ribonuclease Z [Proteobacteria bacterium]|nr:ribonuclease Z [Pseudomonadota bacterium]
MRPLVHCHLVNDPFGDPALYAEFMFERRAVLFDLGSLEPLAPRKLLKVSHVFVSHTHMDHFAGFDRLLRIALGRETEIALFGPPGFIASVKHKLDAYTWNLVGSYEGNLSFLVVEVGAEGGMAAARFQSRTAFAREPAAPPACAGGALVEDRGFAVHAALLDHGTPSLAFALQETTHVNVWKNRLAERGLAVGPWLRELKRAVLAGEPEEAPFRVRWREGGEAHERLVPLGELKREVLSVVPGQKIAYVADVRASEENARRIEALARGADLLFIETPFLEADAEVAGRKAHLTARRAGLIARRAGAKRMVPFHFSPRYADREDALRREAEDAFAGAAGEPLSGGPGSD